MDRQTTAKVSKSGGIPRKLADTTDKVLGAARTSFLAVDQENVYWLDSRPKSKQVIMKVNKGGGEATVLAEASNLSHSLVVDETSVYWVGTSDAGWGVRRLAKPGGDPILLIGEVGPGNRIIVDETNVYRVDAFDVLKVGKKNGKSKSIASDFVGAVDSAVDSCLDGCHMAVDRENLYWAVEDKIMKINKSGGKPVVIYSGIGFASGIAVDPTSVYWSDSKQGTIMKIGK